MHLAGTPTYGAGSLPTGTLPTGALPVGLAGSLPAGLTRDRHNYWRQLRHFSQIAKGRQF